jgi:Uma2 family endonuclease
MNIAADMGIRRHQNNVEEYYRMAEVGLLAPDAHVELIEGEIIDMAPIGTKHAATVDALTELFAETLRKRVTIAVQRPIRLSANTEPQPDLALLKRREDFYRNSSPIPPDVLLLIEVSDTSLRYDLNVKAPLYARHGIPEVWIIDINSKQLHCLREPVGETYVSTKIIQSGIVEIAALPEIEIDISGILSLG